MYLRKTVSLLLALTLVATVLAGCGAPRKESAETNDPTTQASTEPSSEETTVPPTETEAADLLLPNAVEIPEPGEATEPQQAPENAAEIAFGADAVLTEPARGYEILPSDPNRTRYDIGTCKQMEGELAILCIFLDDAQSRWTEQEAVNFLDEDFHPAMQWLLEQAEEWNVELSYQAAYYITNRNIQMEYDGIVGSFLAGNDYNTDVMEQVAASLGFLNKDEFHTWVKDWFKTEQVAYVVITNKQGRSYAMCDAVNETIDYMEYVMLFNQDTPTADGKGVYTAGPSTVSHELLHLFGAEDAYPEGLLRNGRAALADRYFYDDVMRRQYFDVSYNIVGDFTAFTVGWTDVTPAVCYDSNWWK